MKKITIEDLLIAYRKVKVDCYYETGHITAYSFAIYEQNLMDNLNELLHKIVDLDYAWFECEEFIGKHHLSLKKIDFNNSLSQSDKTKKEVPFMFFSNPKRKWANNNESNLEVDYRIIGNHSVNFHVLSSLWIEKVGKFLELNISAKSYGCRINSTGQKSDQLNSNDEQRKYFSRKVLGHFRPYLADYQDWQYNGLDKIKSALADNKKILAVTADLKKYYHRIDCSFIESNKFLQYLNQRDYLPVEKKLNKLLISAIKAWSDNVFQDPKIPKDFKCNGHSGVPMGLGASKVIANLLLTYLDRQIDSEIKPIYYGRYVDDIFLVIEDGRTIDSASKFWHFIQKRIENVTKAGEDNKNSDMSVNEYFPKGYVLDIPYSQKSLVEFGEGKEKYFFLDGSSGESFLSTLKESMDENSSEWKLPPNASNDIESYSEQVAKASSNYNEAANGFVSNQLMYFLCTMNKSSAQMIAIVQEKTVPAQKEESELFQVGGKKLQAYNETKYLINHGGFWFSGLICNDLLDINNRALLRGLIDALIIVEWNKDIETYDSLVAASSNDLHSFILQVNNRLYGDTRLRGPYKEAYERDKVRVRGGELDYFVVATLEIEKLREFQRNYRSPDGPFKPVPTGFEMSNERRKV